MTAQLNGFYKDKTVLLTGGAGFVGSNIAHALTQQGANVLIIDSFHPSYGANTFNLKGIENQVELVRANILDQKILNDLTARADLVFHIAAQCSHVDSMIDPWFDLEYNVKGSLCVLEAARLSPKKPLLVYAGTRAIVGVPSEVPVKETTLPNPVDIYGVNKHAAELYGSVYANAHKIPFVSLRLTNSYGPRHQMKNGKYGILNWFISLALQGKPIKIFGTGNQLRDYLYIDDAVEVFLRAGQFANSLRESNQKWPFKVLNVGSGKGIKFADCAKMIVESIGSPLEFVPWPKDREAIETGDFISDGTVCREFLKWTAKTEFSDGLKRTIDFYKENLKHYV